jgi:hypothetical protein
MLEFEKSNDPLFKNETCQNQGNSLISQNGSMKLVEKGVTFISQEASRLDGKFKSVLYKHPFAVMTAALSLGYLSHWLINRSSNSNKA